MSERFDNECPYCGSKDIDFDYDIDDLSEAVDSEKYTCKGSCQKSFYMQKSDERFIMESTMMSKYLSSDSLALANKICLEKIAVKEKIDSELPVCGNCVSFIWGKNGFDNYDRHCGSCSFQNGKFNYTISDTFIRGKLHGLTNAKSCEYLHNFRKNKIQK